MDGNHPNQNYSKLLKMRVNSNDAQQLIRRFKLRQKGGDSLLSQINKAKLQEMFPNNLKNPQGFASIDSSAERQIQHPIKEKASRLSQDQQPSQMLPEIGQNKSRDEAQFSLKNEASTQSEQGIQALVNFRRQSLEEIPQILQSVDEYQLQLSLQPLEKSSRRNLHDSYKLIAFKFNLHQQRMQQYKAIPQKQLSIQPNPVIFTSLKPETTNALQTQVQKQTAQAMKDHYLEKLRGSQSMANKKPLSLEAARISSMSNFQLTNSAEKAKERSSQLQDESRRSRNSQQTIEQLQNRKAQSQIENLDSRFMMVTSQDLIVHLKDSSSAEGRWLSSIENNRQYSSTLSQKQQHSRFLNVLNSLTVKSFDERSISKLGQNSSVGMNKNLRLLGSELRDAIMMKEQEPEDDEYCTHQILRRRNQKSKEVQKMNQTIAYNRVQRKLESQKETLREEEQTTEFKNPESLEAVHNIGVEGITIESKDTTQIGFSNQKLKSRNNLNEQLQNQSINQLDQSLNSTSFLNTSSLIQPRTLYSNSKANQKLNQSQYLSFGGQRYLTKKPQHAKGLVLSKKKLVSNINSNLHPQQRGALNPLNGEVQNQSMQLIMNRTFDSTLEDRSSFGCLQLGQMRDRTPLDTEVEYLQMKDSMEISGTQYKQNPQIYTKTQQEQMLRTQKSQNRSQNVHFI